MRTAEQPVPPIRSIQDTTSSLASTRLRPTPSPSLRPVLATQCKEKRQWRTPTAGGHLIGRTADCRIGPPHIHLCHRSTSASNPCHIRPRRVAPGISCLHTFLLLGPHPPTDKSSPSHRIHTQRVTSTRDPATHARSSVTASQALRRLASPCSPCRAPSVTDARHASIFKQPRLRPRLHQSCGSSSELAPTSTLLAGILLLLRLDFSLLHRTSLFLLSSSCPL